MTPGRERIAFKNVSVRFPTQDGGSMQVVDDVSYGIADREFVSVIGPSGCGKTTMMNIVAGFMQPSAGSVTLDGKPISGPGPDRGVIFQDYGVFPWLTVKDNIAFGLNLRANRTGATERDEICQRYMRLMGLSDFADAWPRMLSGGMRQRVMIAMALACEPSLLIADEPTTALDVTIQAQILELLAKLKEQLGMAVLLITHDLGVVAEVCTDVAVMYAGHIIEIATVEHVAPHPNADRLRLCQVRKATETVRPAQGSAVI